MNSNITWRPTADINTLHQRAKLIKQTRAFFDARAFLEVETPILSQYTVTDPFINSFSTHATQLTPKLYLQTSPEYHMKRLLAAGSGPIFQLTKAFRQDEAGSRHNPEFTILEWYRPGYNHHQLMDEMNDFLMHIFNTHLNLTIKNSERISYQEVFEFYLQINPLTASIESLQQCVKNQGIEYSALNDENADKDICLDILMSHCIEPNLGQTCPIFIYDYPASQAALSIQQGQVGERFEVYYKGIELANGFHELTDSIEQRARFIGNLEKRKKLNLPELSLDKYFLEALNNGFPPSSGVALGFDRLMMLALGKKNIQEVMSFSITNA